MKKRVEGMFKIACIVGTHCFKKLKKNAFVKAWIANNHHPAQDKPNWKELGDGEQLWLHLFLSLVSAFLYSGFTLRKAIFKWGHSKPQPTYDSWGPQQRGSSSQLLWQEILGWRNWNGLGHTLITKPLRLRVGEGSSPKREGISFLSRRGKTGINNRDPL